MIPSNITIELLEIG